MAAADWESVGGARTPESERFAAELVDDVGVTVLTKSGSNRGGTERAEEPESDTTCNVPVAAGDRRRRE